MATRFSPDRIKQRLKTEGPKSTYHWVLEALAARERPRMVTDIRRLRYEMRDMRPGEEPSPEEVEMTFQDFHKAGAGVLSYARDVHDTARFKWTINPLDMSREVLGISEAEARLKSARFAGAIAAPPMHSVPVKLSTGDTLYLPMGVKQTDLVELTRVMKLLVELGVSPRS